MEETCSYGIVLLCQKNALTFQNYVHIMCGSNCEDIQLEYKVKENLEGLNEHKATGHLIRSKAIWTENGENSIQTFLQVQSWNYISKYTYIKTLNGKDKMIKDKLKNPRSRRKCLFPVVYRIKFNARIGKYRNSLLFKIKLKVVSDTDKNACNNSIPM